MTKLGNLFKRGTSWSFRYKDGQGKDRWESTGADDKKIAEKVRQRRFLEINGLIEPKSDGPTWDELITFDHGWLSNPARGRAQGTADLSELALRHLRAAMGDARPKAVQTATVEAFMRQRRAVASQRTVRREIASLRATWNRAIRATPPLLTSNPWIGLDTDVPEPVENIPITPAEETALLTACGDDLELEAVICVGLDTGCRIGEVLSLMWENVDLERGVVEIRARADWKPKTRKGRLEYLTPETCDRLRVWRLRRRSALVFLDPGENYRTLYRKVLRRFHAVTAPITEARTRQVGTHDLRRTVASRIEAVADTDIAAAIMGHADANVTRKFYVADAVLEEKKRLAVLKMRQTA